MSDIKAEREAIRAEQTAAQQEYDYWKNVKTLLNRQDVNTTEQIAEEQSADANLSVAENETLQPGQTVEETTAAKQEKQPQYPVDEAGEPLWYEMTDGQFDVAIAELGDTADAFIADKIKEAQKAKEKAEKAKPKSTEFAKRKAEQQAITAEKAAAQKAYDYWTAQQARRIGASQRKAPQVTQQVGENITGKYQTSNRTYGNTDTYILPNGEKINGRYVIVEADAITPSHDVNNGYQKSEGFPTDENGNTINDRDYQADKSAQTIVEQNAANYDARAIQTPVIVTNQGIVLSGNGRTMSGQIASGQGTDTEYLSYLKDHAGRYGFTAEQISGYQHPRLVLEVSDNVPLNAETFAKFNAEDKKTISPTEKAVKAGKTVTDITLEKIAALLDDKETLSDVYADETATAQIIKILQSDGVININEVAELMDGKKLSAQGKDFLETLLVGKILNEQSVRLVAQMRNIRATVIKSIMPLLNNSRLRKGQNGENYSLSDELNKAIEFIYAADRANMPITDYISQTNLFDANPADIYDTATQIIAVALTKGQNNFKQFVNKYNTAAEHAASGQIDIFAGRIKTKKEILKEITGTYGNTGQAAADTQSRLGNSKVKSGIQSVRGDDAGNGRTADAGGRGTEQGTGRGIGPDGDSRGSRDSRRSGQISANPAIRESNKAVRTGMTREEALSIVASMEEHAEVAPELALTPENWVREFGEDGIVNTPIGEVKMGDHQYAKMMRQNRNGKLGMVKPTLENPDIIVEDISEAKDGDITERGSSYVFVKAFIKLDGSRYYYFTSVTIRKDGHEVVVSNQEKRRNVLTNLLVNGKLAWKHADNVSVASDVANGLYSSQGNVSDPAIEGTDAPQTNYSESKYSKESPDIQEADNKNSNLPENEAQNAASPSGGDSNLSKNKANSTEKLLNEAEYINLRLNDSFENRKDKTLSRKDWENTDEYIEIYNNVADEYPAYIANLGKSGELQNMFDKGTVSERIKIQNAIETAGYSVPDFIDRENVNKEAREKREARRKEKMRETMNTLGIDPDTGKLKQPTDTEERYRESEEPVSRQKQTGIPYRLSGELDENGHPFVLASDGTTTFGEIRADSGLQPAPIKLSRGIQDENGKGYGLLHIEANHGEEIRKAGFSSVNDFVSFIAHNYDKDNIRVGKRRHNGNITYLLQVTDSHDNTLFIEMSRDGSYWNVNSAGVFRKKYSNKKETVVKTEPQQPNNAISAGSSLSENEERGITSSEPNGEPPVSNSKYSKESSNVQEPLRHRTGEEAGSRDIIDMTEEELAEIRAKEREKIDRIFGKEYLDNVAEAVEKRKAERKAVVSKAARELRSELTASPDIVLVSDLKDIPEEELQGKTPQEAIRRMRAKGWYTPGNGKVYINLSMHSTAEDVKATILHEAVAHKGLRALLGEESFGALCDAVYRSMPKKRQKAYEDTYKKIYPNTAEAELRRIIADEYMARLAEGGVRQSIPQRIISAIREFLRSIGIDLDINDADIRHLLAQSYKNMQEADAVKVLDNSALLARLRKAAEETHIKSEAESLYRLGDNNKTFSERVNRAVENKGTVMPNLAEENLKVINIPKHKYKGSVVEAIKQAEEDARKKYQGKTLYYDNYGTAFDYTISGESIEKSISKKATDKSTNIGIHIAVLNRLDEVIANSIEVEEHPDYKKGADEERRPENGYNANTLIHRFYGAIKIDGIVYRVKTTMKESRSAVEGNKQYSYEVTNVERLNADALSRSNDLGGLTSSREDALPLTKIIEKETKSYEKGKKILEASRESDIRFRFTPEEQQVNIASEASDRRYTETDKAPEIDYDMPAGDVAEQVSAKAAIEPLYRLDVFDKDFASEIAIQEAMQQCVSINSNNPPFTVNMADIYGMYRVLFCMSIK